MIILNIFLPDIHSKLPQTAIAGISANSYSGFTKINIDFFMPSQKNKRLPNQIRRYRLKNNLRLREVTKLVGLTSPAHLSHWEKGRKLPKLINALKLAVIIGSPVEILFKGLFDDIRHDVFVKRHGSNDTINNNPYDAH